MSFDVAVSMRVVVSPDYGEERDVLSRDWYLFFAKCGIRPLLVPNIGKSVKKFLLDKGIDGIILTGGNNISPVLCPHDGGEPIGDTSEIRDETEAALLELAVENEIPLIGVCRGIQVINAYFGGGIIFNFTKKGEGRLAHAGTTHDVLLTDERMKCIAGTDRICVNSYHNHAFTEKEKGKGLVAAAVAADGSVEAVIHESLPIAGIMWHPERPDPVAEFDMKYIKSILKI